MNRIERIERNLDIFSVKVKKLKVLDRIISYVQLLFQLAVGIAGGITSVLTLNRLYNAVYTLNTVVPALVFCTFILNKVKQSIRVNVQKKNLKRAEMLECLRELKINQSKGDRREIADINLEYNMLVSILKLDTIYLKPVKPSREDGSSNNNNDFTDTIAKRIENVEDATKPIGEEIAESQATT